MGPLYSIAYDIREHAFVSEKAILVYLILRYTRQRFRAESVGAFYALHFPTLSLFGVHCEQAGPSLGADAL